MSLRLLSVAVLALTLTVEAPSRAAAPASASVSIGNFTFSPQVLTVRVGEAVTWTNRDDAPHAVVANDRSFRSKVMDTDQSFSFTFAKPGDYSYFCSIHPHMMGKVVVKAL